MTHGRCRDEVALDGVEEFQVTCCATTAAWPHEPAVVDCHAGEGRSWRLRLSGDGARADRLPAPGTSRATASARGTASDLMLVFYGRIPLDSLELDGDRRVFDRLIAWDPDAQGVSTHPRGGGRRPPVSIRWCGPPPGRR